MTTVYAFGPVQDDAENPVPNTTGAFPNTTLVLDAQGNLAGATEGGGIGGAGVVYRRLVLFCFLLPCNQLGVLDPKQGFL